MKTKTLQLLFLCLFGTVFTVQAQQYTIEGPSVLCPGDCGVYYLLDDNGFPVTSPAVTWTVNGGVLGSVGAGVADICMFDEIVEILVLVDGNTSVSFIVLSDLIEDLTIVPQSTAACLSDSLNPSTCDQVCAFSSATYTVTGIDPTSSVEWQVSGAESYSPNGNQVTVNWGDAGYGLVNAQAFEANYPLQFTIDCIMLFNGEPDFNSGVGGVIVNGMPGTYDFYFSNGDTQTASNNTIVATQDLVPGTYSVTVTDELGNTQECAITIQQDYPFNVLYESHHPESCDECTGSLYPSHFSGGTGPYSYEWSTGETTPALFDLCPGTYGLTITDADGNSIVEEYSIYCPTGLNNCQSYGELCVEILEEPTADFTTTPPPVNGVVEICEGQTVFFENQSVGASLFTWDFGNLVSASSVNAEHTYLSAGTYEAFLIARNDCFCGDTSSVTIIVEEAIAPTIDCAGTVCPGEEITYTADADCGTFTWMVTGDGTVVSGGGLNDDYITINWGSGPEGIIGLDVSDCNGDYCLEPLLELIPIIDDNAEIVGPERVCRASEVTYSITPFEGTSFTWTTSNLGTINTGQGTNEITVQWADVLTSGTQYVAVEYESCYLGCGGRDTIWVDILAEFFVEGEIEVCPGQSYTFNTQNAETGGGVVDANWTIYDINNNVVQQSGAASENFTVNFNFGSGQYFLVATADTPENFCVDDYTIFLTVADPTPAPAGVEGELNICPGETYTYQVTGANSGFSYNWYIINGGSSIIRQGEAVNITWGASPPYNINLTQTNVEGLPCESPDIGVSIQPISTVDIDGPAALCREEIGIYSATTYEEVEYNWSISPANVGSIISGEGTHTIEIQWHSTGNHIVELDLCGISQTYNVVVNELPQPVVLDAEACPGQTTTVQTTAPFVSYVWRNETGSQVSTAPSPNLGPGYYEVIVTDVNGCTGNTTFYIEELPSPSVTISTPDLGNFCEQGGSMVLYALESSSGLDYQWYFNGSPVGTNSSSLTVTQEGSYYVIVTDQNGCTGQSNVLGLSCGILPGPPSVCEPLGDIGFTIVPGNSCNESQYLNTSINDIPGTWSWAFFDIVSGSTTTSGQENPNHTWGNAGFNLVTFAVQVPSTTPGQNCLLTTYSFDTIPLVANFASEPACIGQPSSFFDLSVFVPQTSIAGWTWNFGDPASGIDNVSTLQNPQHVYSTPGFYSVTLTTTDQSGCISEFSETIEILPPPLSSFSIPGVSCVGGAVAFSATGQYTNVIWDFGDPGSGDANSSSVGSTYHVYENPGTYTVTLTVENIYGCTESTTQNITIDPVNLSGLIDVVPANTICEGDQATLTAPLGNAYQWSTNEVSQSITVNTSGVYEVTVYDALGCAYYPPSVTIDVIAAPDGQITAVEYDEYGQPINTIYNNYETCYGDDVFLQVTENVNYAYEWSTTDMTTEISFTEEKDNLLEVGTHDFTVTITDLTSGCTSEIGPFTVTVHPVPEGIIITSNPTEPICENTITEISVFNPDPNYTYIWNTGEIGTSITTFYAGEYFVRAINIFGCEGISNRINITEGPNIDLVPQGCHTRCNPDTICLPFIPDVASYQWFLDGVAVPAPEGTMPDLIATESGVYTVEMTSTSGCVALSGPLTLDLYDGFGSVLGSVYFDVNANGIIDAGDTLVPDIPVILQNGGINLDTLITNGDGNFGFVNILSTDYDILLDNLNLPPNMTPVIDAGVANLVGCDDEAVVDLLLMFQCTAIYDSLDLEVCENSSVIYQSVELFPGMVQDFTFTSIQSCDSIVTVSVTGLDTSHFALTLFACPDGTVNYNGTDLDPGSVTDFTFTNAIGCDSIVTVTVEPLAESSSELELFACPDGTVNYNGTDLDPGSVTDFTFTNAIGCDSTVTVTVEPLEESSSELALSACPNSTVDYNGTDLDPGSVTDFTFTNAVGCDSVVTVTVSTAQQDSMGLMLSACSGNSVDYNGSTLEVGSITDFTFTNTVGCDSIVTVMVLENTPSVNDTTYFACTGDFIFHDGIQLVPGTDTTFIYTNAVGCDSTLSVTVVELLAAQTDTILQTCENSSLFFDGVELFPNTITDFNYTAANLCDSTVTVSVLGLPTSDSLLNLAACENGTVSYNGDELAAGSTTTYTFMGYQGCDSVVTVVVETLLASDSLLELSTCENSSINYNGDELLPNTTTEYTFTNAVGCDSTVTVMVAGTPLSGSEVNLAACPGESVEYNGTQLPAGSTTTFILDDINGCDSTVTVVVDELPSSAESLFLYACEGSYVTYQGQQISAGLSEAFTFTNSSGCDSLVNVFVLTYPEIQTTFIELFACADESVEYNGETLAVGSLEEYILTAANGCDSLVEVAVTAYPEFSFTAESDMSCWNEDEGTVTVNAPVGGVAPFVYSLDGNFYQQQSEFIGLTPGDYTLYLQDANGCIESEPITVDEIEPLDIRFLESGIPCDYSPVRIGAEVLNAGGQNINYLWNNGDQSQYINVDTPGVYTLIVDNLCETITHQFNIEMIDDGREDFLFVPNVFSPNDDGFNDEFQVFVGSGVEVLSFEMHVFDRWGNALYEFENAFDSWNGAFRSKAMDEGVYVWYYEARVLTCGRELELFDKGDVTIVR